MFILFLQALKTEGIRCSVIGLAAEVRICKKLCQDTGGEYGVSYQNISPLIEKYNFRNNASESLASS